PWYVFVVKNIVPYKDCYMAFLLLNIYTDFIILIIYKYLYPQIIYKYFNCGVESTQQHLR
ncbi:hypothetical protein L6B47_00130, partial [Staphylococcus aureus]|uniref:hypothetical protein n=1 Tax=Staphylococcus aureus TaxID=1280 RepID=UPI002147D39C